jgi:hypothetical protein
MNRRRLSVIVLIVLAMSWALGPSALAAAPPKTASLIDGLDVCPPVHLTGSSVGTATLTRTGDAMVVDIQLTGAQASTTYTFDLWANPGCVFLYSLGSFTTNASGDGSGSFGSVDVTGYAKFFVYIYSGTRHQSPQAVTKTVTVH